MNDQRLCSNDIHGYRCNMPMVLVGAMRPSGNGLLVVEGFWMCHPCDSPDWNPTAEAPAWFDRVVGR